MGFFFSSFAAVSKKAVCESQASCNVLLCGLGKMSRTENIFTERRRARITSHAWDLALLTSLDAAFLTSLAFLGGGVLWTVDARSSVTVLASTRLVERLGFASQQVRCSETKTSYVANNKTITFFPGVGGRCSNQCWTCTTLCTPWMVYW